VLQIGRSLVQSQLVSVDFSLTYKSFRSHYGPGVDSASNKWVPGVFSGGKGSLCVRLTTYHHPVPLSRNMGTLSSRNLLSLCRPVRGLLYLYLFHALIAVSAELLRSCFWNCWSLKQGEISSGRNFHIKNPLCERRKEISSAFTTLLLYTFMDHANHSCFPSHPFQGRFLASVWKKTQGNSWRQGADLSVSLSLLPPYKNLGKMSPTSPASNNIGKVLSRCCMDAGATVFGAEGVQLSVAGFWFEMVGTPFLQERKWFF